MPTNASESRPRRHTRWSSGSSPSCTIVARSCRSSRLHRRPPESPSAEAERLLFFALVGAIEAGLVRTAEGVLLVLRQASQPLWPMGAEWLKRQERRLEGER